jgi:hypothetical protein
MCRFVKVTQDAIVLILLHECMVVAVISYGASCVAIQYFIQRSQLEDVTPLDSPVRVNASGSWLSTCWHQR